MLSLTRLRRVSIILVVSTGACSGREFAPRPLIVVPVRDMAQSLRATDTDTPAEERNLEDQFLSRFSGERQDRYRQMLSDYRIQLSLPNEPANQALLDRLYQLRSARFSARPLTQAATASNGPSITIGLVGVPVGADTGVLVLRRQSAPQELVLLSSATATGEHLAAALEVAERLRERAEVKALREQRVSVTLRSAQFPARWLQERARLDSVLSALRTAPSQTIADFGPVRLVTIPMPALAKREHERIKP